MSASSKQFNCVLIGQQSLLIECGQQLLDRDHTISLVISSDPDVAAWCNEHSLEYREHTSSSYADLDKYQFDYLFSIVNLKIIPAEVLKLPARMAINFHDGPLPRYAGINAPVWAILNQEAEYGVTWHQMTEQADAGDIIKQHTFPIATDETAFSLNIKCLEQGLACFNELLNDIENDKISPVAHQLDEASYCPPCKEMSLGIDLSGPAEAISALTRALEFGPYYNPVGLARLPVNDRQLIVRQADVLEQSSNMPAGTLVSYSDSNIVFSTATRDISLSVLPDQSVRELKPGAFLSAAGVNIGDSLDTGQEALLEKGLQTRRDFCLQEAFWIRHLTELQLTTLPYVRDSQAVDNKSLIRAGHQDLPELSGLSGRQCLDMMPAFLAAVLAYLYRLTGNESTGLVLDVSALHESKNHNLYQTCIPFIHDVNSETGFADHCRMIEAGYREVQTHLVFASDLPLRTPELRSLPYYTDDRLFPVVLAVPGEPGQDEIPAVSAALYIRPAHDFSGLEWFYHADVHTARQIEIMQQQFRQLVSDLPRRDRLLCDVNLLDQKDIQSLLIDWNATGKQVDYRQGIQQLFAGQVAKTPDQLALVCGQDELSYAELNRRANRLAHYLIGKGVGPEQLVGIHMKRSTEMMIALLATLKAGGAYVPLDPAYPGHRIQYMVEDSGSKVVISDDDSLLGDTKADFELVNYRKDLDQIEQCSSENPELDTDASNAAYVIYTSGSTGQPKGVVVEQANVVNFFSGMDDVLEHPEPGTWLAVTSISFDISVLELFWTLTRGFTVVLYVEPERYEVPDSKPAIRPVDFSLFYWNLVPDDQGNENKYRLLLESAKYGDENGFTAVWTPERHFHDFGGLFPNPSVTSAALAVATKNVKIRAGSCVLPLHNPVRVAEEWAVVDNLSDGRVGMAVASGWQPEDFVIKPENFTNAKTILFESLEQLRRLWKGETLVLPGPKGDVTVSTLPRPVQKELPVWATVAGNPETFVKAAEAGAGILTHLLGQTIEELAEKLELYRSTWRQCGHPGQGHVVVMLHTLVSTSTEKAKEIARAPMKKYLASAMFLVKKAAWNFPTFKATSEETGESLDEYFEAISDADLDDLLEFAFERYFSTSGLFGSPEDCLDMISRVNQAGVDEIACLIDYGVNTDVVLENLPYLNELKQLVAEKVAEQSKASMSLPALVDKYQVTHFQCTPSMAGMLLADAQTSAIFSRIKNVLIGGESMTENLARELVHTTSLINMYGPTETTIWSSSYQVKQEQKQIPVGKPLANTRIYILDQRLRPVPAGIRGEICIAGDGVVRGYLNRPELTGQRFVELDIPGVGKQRLYRTGDYGCLGESGQLICMGRMDHQVKLRGFRIELGEIDSALEQDPSVEQAVTSLYTQQGDAPRLVAYYRSRAGTQATATSLRNSLREILPDHMIPQHFVELGEFPLTPNRKVDRNRLPSPLTVDTASRDIIPPETETEQVLAAIWSELVGVDGVSRDDNFIIIGGHSILAMQALATIRETLGVNLSAVTIYQEDLKAVARECDKLMEQKVTGKQEKSMLAKWLGKLRNN